MTELPKSLAERLTQEITSNGPVRIDTYMTACLVDPTHGYYLTRNPLGAQGDFITAPETSQIFGELIGLWCVTLWQSMGKPERINLIELGPGAGTLMSDAIRAMSVAPEMLKAVSCHLIEISPLLRGTQEATLSKAPCPIQWHADLGAVEPGPSIIIANEFFDALPVRQFIKQGPAWHERLITVDSEGNFVFTTSSEALSGHDFIPQNLGEAPDGAIFELREANNHILSTLANRAASHPQAALVIDYGHEQSAYGDTLQAVHAHNYADPLQAQGDADLTTHVDFASLAQDAAKYGLKTCGPIQQGPFLLSLGLAPRVERLLAAASDDQASLIVSGAQRLIDPDQMGNLFKVLAITSTDLPTPPAFEG